MGGRPEPEYALRRVMSSEQTHDEQLTANSRQNFLTRKQNDRTELITE